MHNKVTWGDIYKDFRTTHPNLRNEVLDYRPYDYLTIILYFRDGRSMVYKYTTKECHFLSDSKAKN